MCPPKAYAPLSLLLRTTAAAGCARAGPRPLPRPYPPHPCPVSAEALVLLLQFPSRIGRVHRRGGSVADTPGLSWIGRADVLWLESAEGEEPEGVKNTLRELPFPVGRHGVLHATILACATAVARSGETDVGGLGCERHPLSVGDARCPTPTRPSFQLRDEQRLGYSISVPAAHHVDAQGRPSLRNVKRPLLYVHGFPTCRLESKMLRHAARDCSHATATTRRRRRRRCSTCASPSTARASACRRATRATPRSAISGWN